MENGRRRQGHFRFPGRHAPQAGEIVRDDAARAIELALRVERGRRIADALIVAERERARFDCEPSDRIDETPLPTPPAELAVRDVREPDVLLKLHSLGDEAILQAA